MDYLSKEKVIETLRDLISHPSPYFHEGDLIEYVKNYFCSNGLPAQIHEFYDSKETQFHGKNMVLLLDSGKPGPSIYIGGHLDTVKLCNGWTRDPYAGSMEGDYMYGVGALDMKAGCTAIMLALTQFYKNYHDRFRGRIICHLVSDEEGPYGLGTIFLMNDNVHNICGDLDFALICEPSAGFTKTPHPCVCLGARGGYSYTIKVHGKSAHGATPALGINAVYDAAAIICELEKSKPMIDEKLGQSERCVIGINSSTGACSVPDYAEIHVFQHTVRGESIQTIRADVEKAIQRANVRSYVEIYFRTSPVAGLDGGFPPYCIDEKNPTLGILRSTIEDVLQQKCHDSYFQSIGDFNYFGGTLQVPTVLFGPDGANYHGADEYVNISSTTDVTRVLYEFLQRTNL